MKRLFVIAGLLFIVLPGAASAADPWQLSCPSMPAEAPTPAPLRGAVQAFFPWVRPPPRSLRAGSVYLIALSNHTEIARDGDKTDSAGYYLHRVLIAIDPSEAGLVTVTGRRLGPAGTRTTLGFSTNGATKCNVHRSNVTCEVRRLRFASALRIAPSAGWRIVATELRIGRTGCFRLEASGPHLDETIPISVPGPDYDAAGW